MTEITKTVHAVERRWLSTRKLQRLRNARGFQCNQEFDSQNAARTRPPAYIEGNRQYNEDDESLSVKCPIAEDKTTSQSTSLQPLAHTVAADWRKTAREP